MKVTITTPTDEIFNLDVSEDLELENFKAFCEVESGIPAAEILIFLAGHPITDNKKSLKELGVSEGDVLIIQPLKSAPSSGPGFGFARPAQSQRRMLPFDFSSIQVPGPAGSTPTPSPTTPTTPGSSGSGSSRPQPEDDPAYIRDLLLNDPKQLAIMRQNQPDLAEALTSGNYEKFASMIREMQKRREDKQKLKQRLMTSSEFDPEAQKLIADEIRQKNIDANMEAAMEFNPESFGTVVMLYIDCKVNGYPVKAFIDSGCQTTIMSTGCAERCNIMRLIDTRFSGIAKGVGTQKILGRVHMGQIQIGDVFLSSSFSILEAQKTDMLFGLDMLRRHQCSIDLNRNVLVIGTTGTETRFLPESELPDSARLNYNETLKEHEESMPSEDIGLTKAIEESVRDHKKQKDVSEDPSPSASSNASNTGSSSHNFNEATVQKLMKMGFPRDQVLKELANFDGNETQTIAALLAKSLQF